ncbi:immunoglobulin domain-containing protein, partial [Leucobacter chinensis]|uniref:immunoglobulin domain-containing protein n=1 Tax=Leucobacter chinensis TaxID=2851010 RepID=UPI001C229A91
MKITAQQGSRSRRSLAAPGAFGVAAALLLSGAVATPSFAAEDETSTGTPYSNTDAYMTVTPGTNLNPDGTTTVTVRGFNYDEKVPVYVGLGTNLAPEDPELWRRSDGGLSGPDGDYDYGSPRLVIAYGNSEDTGVADAAMDANGNWKFDIQVAGATLTSFFGGEIDCLEAVAGCGFFSFGAHGKVSAHNEAYVGISFAEPVVTVAPEISQQPQSVSVNEGEDAVFSVTATGDPEPTYAWQRAEKGSDTFAPITGATSAEFTLAAASLADDGAKLRVVVTNEAGAVTSEAVSLAVAPKATEPEDDKNSATGLGHNHDPNKQGQPSLKVTWPEGGFPADEPSVARLEGQNYALLSDFGTNFGGAYTLFGVIKLKDEADEGSWAPTKRGVSGVNYDYVGEAGLYQLMVNYPDNTTEPDMAYMDDQGNWVIEEHPVPGATFTSQGGAEINCLAEGVQCGFITIGAHGQLSKGVEVFTPVQFAEPAAPAAVETSVTVNSQPYVEYPTDFAGETVKVSASVQPADAAGSVAFFTGETKLGEAAVAEGSATIETTLFEGGAHKVRAVFTPENAEQFEASESNETTFRIVDLTPAVGTIEVGAAAREITDAELRWGVANFVSFHSGPGKAVLGGNVELATAEDDSTQALADREFIFSKGTGHVDAEGNVFIEYDGEIRLTSGTMPEWNFRQPQLFMNAAGDGYLSVVADGHFLGSMMGGEDLEYGPERIVVQTFKGAEPVTEATETSFTVAPLFEGQVAPGTWSGDFSGATLTNQFLRFVNIGVRSYFYQSGGSADPTKVAKPLTVTYTSGVAPTVSVAGPAKVTVGDDAVFNATIAGDPEPELQWQTLAPATGDEARAADAEENWVDVEGATAKTFTLEAVTEEMNGTKVRAIASNGFGEAVASEAVELLVTKRSTEEPGTEEPGTEEPGTEEPGTEEPGTEEPGTEEPGTEEPGTEEPGTEEPGTEEPGT